MKLLAPLPLILLVACGGTQGSDDERFQVHMPDDTPGPSGPPAALARPGGEVPVVEYDTGPNVASVEDRGQNCALPELPGFADLEAQPRLPDPFLSLSTPEAPGARIANKVDWTCRRAEIAAQAQAYELGPKPPRPKNVSGSFDGSALTVTVDDGGPQIQFSATLTPPATGEGPFPAMIVLGGSTALDEQGTISGQGVTLIQFPHDQIAEQQGSQSYGKGLFFDLYGATHSAGALVAWAWGVSRLIDALELTPDANVDTTRLGVTGCSRNGKGALVVGALDERIALTLPQESGAGGSALWRMAQVNHQKWVDAGKTPDYADVQTLSSAAGENAWFRRTFSQFGSAVDQLPFDHHMLMGLVAPRALLLVNNTDQYWLDREGSHFGGVFARSIWQSLGIPTNMGGSQIGDSSHCSDVPALQLEHVAAFVQKFLVGDPSVDTDILYTDGGYADVSAEWVDWATPALQ